MCFSRKYLYPSNGEALGIPGGEQDSPFYKYLEMN